MLIQFGHNDLPGKRLKRETDPATTYRELLKQYVDDARAVGAKPILVTSVVRRGVNPDRKLDSTLAAYADAAKAVAQEKQTPLVDLHDEAIRRIFRLLPRVGPLDRPRRTIAALFGHRSQPPPSLWVAASCRFK